MADTFIEHAIQTDLFGPAGLGDDEETAAPPKYEILRRLGRGGSGVVWLARDRVLGRPVALKFLLHAREQDIERFRREARYTARLDDAAIVKIYETGEAGGRPFIAMQYVDGPNLADATLDRIALLKIIRRVAIALRHAHAQGIVHRDIKPQNILVDREGRAYVTDFGVARDLRREAGATLNLEGWIVGTPALMSPEQAAGDSAAIDGRSDVYSLGATLYALLVNRLPFERPNTVDVLHAVIHDPPPFPRSIDPSIPRALEAVAMRCLQKDREARYQSMAELVEEVDRLLAGQPVPSESAAWFRKLVGAPSTKLSGNSATDQHLPIVVEAASDIAGWDANLYRISSNLPRAELQLDAIISRLDGILSLRPDFALARFWRGVALARRGRLEEALPEMERSIDRVGELARAHFELGRLYLALHLAAERRARKHLSPAGVDHHLAELRGRLEPAAAAFREARRLHEDLAPWQLDFARAVEHLTRNEFDGCVAVCDEILARDPDVDEVWKLRGDALRFAGREPFESYDRAIQIRRSFYEAVYAKAEAHAERGAYAEARACLTRVLEIRPDFVDAIALTARTHLKEGALDQALAFLSESLERDPNHYEAAVTHAELLIELGQLGTALETLDRAGGMQGCGNRVQLLRARALLERARRSSERGEDPGPDLKAILEMAGHVLSHEPDNGPWREILERARATA